MISRFSNSLPYYKTPPQTSKYHTPTYLPELTNPHSQKENNMKNTYHLCLSSSNEIMFRDEEDYHRGFNCFALALHKTGSSGLAEAFMSTHTHQIVQSDSPQIFMQTFRQSYAMYFNHKYQRRGHLGESMHFSIEVIGYHHLIAALSYVLRNGLHHGVAPIPYAYPHCSANAFFRKELGKFCDERTLPRNNIYKYVGRRAEFPDSYKMSESGVFLRESVLDVPQVENLFVTPRSYNYYMSRKSSEEWENEQKKDKNDIAPITLTSIENGVNMHSLEKMYGFENGKAEYRKTSDIELCTELDALSRDKYNKCSVYQLSITEKEAIAEYLYRTRCISESQIRRCLVFHK